MRIGGMAVRHTLPPVPSQAPRLITIPISHYLDVDDTTAAESRGRVRAVFDEVGERLADGRR
jgi:hypothetical protein